MWLLGAGTNAGMQYADSGEINPVNSVAAGWINVITMGQGWKGTIAWNAAGGASDTNYKSTKRCPLNYSY